MGNEDFVRGRVDGGGGAGSKLACGVQLSFQTVYFIEQISGWSEGGGGRRASVALIVFVGIICDILCKKLGFTLKLVALAVSYR